MGQYGKNDSQRIRGHGKKRSNRSRSPTDWTDRDFCQDNVQFHEEIRGDSTNLRAHTLHAMEDKHEHKRHIVERDMAGTAEMVWEQKNTNAGGSGTHIQGPEHHLPVPS